MLLRVWLPDRPGALGAVASRIGAVRGDIVGIDVLERNDGVAIDEFGVVLSDAELLPLLLREVEEVDGCRVENVTVVSHFPDPRLDALISVALVCEADDAAALQRTLATYAGSAFQADWVAVMHERPDPRRLRQPPGRRLPRRPGPKAPPRRRPSPPASPDPTTLPPHPCPSWRAVLLVGRTGNEFRERERAQLLALARIADHVWRRLDPSAARVLRRCPETPSGPSPVSTMPLALVTGSRPHLRPAGRGPRPDGLQCRHLGVAGVPSPRRAAPFDCYVQLPCADGGSAVCRIDTLAAVAGRLGPNASVLLAVEDVDPGARPQTWLAGTGPAGGHGPGPARGSGSPGDAGAVLSVGDLCRPAPAFTRLDPVVGRLSGRCRRRLWSRRRSGPARRSRSSRPIRFRPSTAPSSIWSAGTIQAISNSSPSGSLP